MVFDRKGMGEVRDGVLITSKFLLTPICIFVRSLYGLFYFLGIQLYSSEFQLSPSGLGIDHLTSRAEGVCLSRL